MQFKNIFQDGNFTLPALAALLLAGVPAANASNISYVDIFKNVSNVQTADGNVLSSNGAFFSAALNATVPNAYSSVTFTPPGGVATPMPLSSGSDIVYGYQSASFASQALMDLAFPFGSYDFSASNGGPADTTSLPYSADHFAGASPFLTGSDFSSLQGFDATQSFTFHFNSFDNALSGRDNSYVFFTIFDYTSNSFVYDAGFLPSTTASLTLPGNTLASGHQFGYEIDFSNRLTVETSNTEFPGFIGFDARTLGSFQSAEATVPEPSTLAMAGLALVAASAFSRRRKA